jgi:hypothetical protein
MKKKLLVIATTALLLAGCAGQAPEASGPTATTTPADAFESQLRENMDDYDRATDGQWLEVGTTVCEAYEAGATPNQVIDSMQGSSVSAEEAAALVIVAAATLCPEFD